MKNNLIFLVFVIFSSCNTKSNEQIQVEINKINDFGVIKVGDTIEKNYKIKNLSKELLIIKNIKTSCGCTVAKIKDSTIEFNKSSEIKVKFIAENNDIGFVQKSIIVETNTNPSFNVLYLKGNVVK